MTAERAWAEYQEIKQEIEAGDSTSRQRNHCIMRLKKAVRHAAELQTLAAVRGTPQTALEAHAYAATLRGQLAQEQQSFADALEGVASARALYELLAASPATMRRLREQFAARGEELAPQERFCRYSLDKSAGRAAAGGKPSEAVMARVAVAVREASAGAGLEPVVAGSSAAAASAVSAAASAGSGDAAASGSAAGAASAPADERVTELYWKGTTLAIRNDKLSRLLTAAAQRARRLLDYETAATASDAAAAAAAAAADGATESIYLDLTAKLEEAARVSAAEASRAAKEGKVSLAVDHAAAEEAIRFAKGRFVLARNDHMIAGAVRALEAALHPAAAVSGSSGAGAAGSAAAGAAEKKDASTSAPAFPAPKSNFFGANPWLAALTDSLTAGASAEAGRGGVTSSAGGAAINPPAVRAAFAVSTWYARAVRTCDELIASAGASLGPATLAPGGSGASAAGGAGSGSGGSSSGASSSSSSSDDAGAELSGDRDLVAALTARRSVYAAWRAYFVGLSHLHARRFVDATKLMHRAQTRADEALASLRLLPASLKPRDLPATPLLPLVLEHAAAAPRGVVASGLSVGDRDAMHSLLDRVSQQTVGLQATALLHQLAARCRRDGAFAEGFNRLAPTLVVQSTAAAAAAAAKAKAKAAARAAGTAAAAAAEGSAGPAAALPGVLPPRNANRPSYLAERTAPTAVAEPVTDVAAIAPVLPLPVAVPFKPLLLDLAINYFAYPDIARRVPKADLKATGAAASPAAAGGAGASPAKGGAGAAAGAQAGGSGILGWLTGR